MNKKEEILEIVRKKSLEDTSGRKALSSKYPILLPAILFVRRFFRNFIQSLNPFLARKKSTDFLSFVIARHSSPLFRKLGVSDPILQIAKVENLKVAIDSLNGVIIFPNETFSFWHFVGATTEKRGYVKGMLLSNGKVVEGVGGGLCQLSNLLYWLFLHTSVKVMERKHHSRDVFPDSERSIPFGTGATIFYNLIDLKIKNTSGFPLQIKLWMSDNQLKGQLLSSCSQIEKYHLKEKEHNFIQAKNGVYRYNEIWRETFTNGFFVEEEKLITNCALTMYIPEHIDVTV